MYYTKKLFFYTTTAVLVIVSLFCTTTGAENSLPDQALRSLSVKFFPEKINLKNDTEIEELIDWIDKESAYLCTWQYVERLPRSPKNNMDLTKIFVNMLGYSKDKTFIENFGKFNIILEVWKILPEIEKRYCYQWTAFFESKTNNATKIKFQVSMHGMDNRVYKMDVTQLSKKEMRKLTPLLLNLFEDIKSKQEKEKKSGGKGPRFQI